MITIAIAEDHQSLVDGIKLLLKYEDEFQLVGEANNGEELIEIVRKKSPNVVLTDIKMPKLDGIAATKIITEKYKNTKIIAFTMFDQEEAVLKMFEAGASGYILKNSPLEQVLLAIKSVMRGTIFLDKSIDSSIFEETTEQTSTKPLLSKSEAEILKLIGRGKSSREIAEARFTSVSTVEKHRKNMILKLGLKGKGELLRYALEKKYDFK